MMELMARLLLALLLYVTNPVECLTICGSHNCIETVTVTEDLESVLVPPGTLCLCCDFGSGASINTTFQIDTSAVDAGVGSTVNGMLVVYDTEKVFDSRTPRNVKCSNGGSSFNTATFLRRGEMKLVHEKVKRQMSAATVPGIPTTLTAIEQTNISLFITWTIPEFNGGSPITDFRVRITNQRTFVIENRFTASVVNEYNITDLAPFTTYTIEVAAINTNGRGDPAIIQADTLSERLDVISAQLITKTSTTIHLQWRHPARDVTTTAPVLRYQVKYMVNNGEEMVTIDILPENYNGNAFYNVNYTLRGLESNTRYDLTIVAFNIVGAGTAFTVPPIVTPTRQVLVSCAAEPDATWGIDWPFTLAGDTAVVSCGANFTGNSSRACLSDGIWAAPDISNCSGRVFSSVQFRITLLVAEEPDVAEVLAVFGELVNATETEAVPLFPQDLNSTINSVNETLTLLEGRLDDRKRQDVTAIFEVLDNLLEVVNVESFDLLQDGGSQRVLDNVERYGLYVARVLQQGSKNRTGTNIVLQAENVNVQMEEVDYVFPNSMEIDTMTNGRDASIVIPSELLVSRANGSDNVSVAHILFRNLQLFLPNDIEGTEPVSLVISSQVDDRGGTGVPDNALMENPVIISFSFTVAEDSFVTTDYNCVFWNFGNTTSEQSGWSPAGLETVSVTRVGDIVTVNCSSSHLTSFAVLVDVRGAQLESEALRIVSYIGLAISLACLLLTIIFFLTFGKKLFTAVHNFVHLNLAIALFIGYLVFAVGVEFAKDNKIACNAVTALIQYFLLSAFCWMMCEGVMLYLMLVVVFSRLSRKWWFFMLLGWGIPVIFVAIGLGAVHDEYGVKDESGDYKYCWLSSGNGTYAIWTFVAPMLAIIIINTVFLVMVLYKIFKNRAGRRQKVNEGIKVDVVTSVVKATVILLPLLGLTWVFGLFAINENTTVFAWLFTIFNSLQGLFIFFFHVVRNDRVWGRFKKKYGEYSASKVSKSTASTGAKSSKYHSEFSSTAGMELKEKRSFADSEATEVRTTLDADEPTKVEPA